MVERILLTGMLSFESGKTHVAKQLAARFHSEGLKVEYFKPISGHNFWYRYEHSKQCIEREQLVSKDATRVREIIKPSTAAEMANPIHRLFVPMIITRPGEILHNTLGLAGWDSIFAIQRFSTPQENGITHVFLVARSLIDQDNLIIRSEDIRSLVGENKVIPVENMEQVQNFENAYYETTVDSAFRRVERDSDVVIIESFNDSIWPWEGLDNVDQVYVIGPGQMFRYDPEKFRKASFLMHREPAPIRSVTLGRISDLMKPLERISLHLGTGIDKVYMDKIVVMSNKGL
ncbi:MAG: hypothetical protein BAJATHORv1_30304 [Candidatus Thorarchaeota archaeon]|nr:MAG: hypothetical protein BAJATHORv1_30304 [Candidatus Thorarchaeota archaeon]